MSNCSAGRLRALVFGHAHQEAAGSVHGLPVYGVPSTCFQFLPRSESFSVDTLPPGYRWLRLMPEGDVHTQVQRVSDFEINVSL